MKTKGKCTPKTNNSIGLGTYPNPYCRIGLKRGDKWIYSRSDDTYEVKRRNVTIILTAEMFNHFMETWQLKKGEK